MGLIRTFGKDALIYGLGSGIKKFIGLFLLPFYTKALTPGDYGILETIGTSVFFVTTFLNLGLDSATAIFFFQVKTEDEKGDVLYTIFILRLFTVFPILILSVFSNFISLALFGTEQYTWAIFVSCLIIPVTLITNEQERIYRLFRQPWKFNNITILKSLLSILFGIGLVVLLDYGVLGAQIASFGSSVLVIVFSFFYFTRKKYTYRFSWPWAKQMLRYGFPIIWAGLAQWVFLSSDRFFLLHYRDLTEIGYYSIGSTFSQPILLISLAIQMSFSVMFYSIYNDEEDNIKPKSKKFAVEILNYTLFVSITIAMILSVFGTNILLLITTPEYYKGALVIPFLCFANISALILQISMMGIEISKKTWHFTWLIAVSALVNVIMNFYFIPKYGFFGAGFTTFFANFLYLVMAYFIARIYFFVPYRVFSLSLYFVITMAFSLVIPIAEVLLEYHISVFIKSMIILTGLAIPLTLKIIRLEDGYRLLKEIKVKIIKFR